MTYYSFKRQKPRNFRYEAFWTYHVGSDLLSHVQDAVPSAQVSLTSLFGMGRGGTSPLKPPTTL
jgi:hypothetical protein